MSMDRTPDQPDASAADTLGYASFSAVRTGHTSAIVCILGATLAPFALMTVGLTIMHTVRGLGNDTVGMVFLVIELTVGTAFIWKADLSIWARAIITLLYLPAILVALFYYGLLFAGCVFGIWL